MVWPVERFAQLAYYLMSRGMAEVILAGADTEEDRLMVERINRLLDKKGRVFFYSTLSQLISLMQTVDLFIGSDSGPMHIAAALGKPVTALFGPTDPRERHPWGSGHEVVWKRLPCSPCNLSECFKGEAGCMAQIEVSTVLQAVGRFLTDT
jgi:ADP-heptose:LPS heptosyltransferase